MNKPKVSIIIPTYNRLAYLKEALVSVRRQNFTDYEIIICDDCSTDGTEDFVRAYLKIEKRLRYYRNSKNMGMVTNWNAGLKRVRGKYVAILNDDDIWKKDFLRKTCALLDTHPNVGLVHTRLTIFQSKGRTKRLLKDHRIYRSSREVPGLDCVCQFLEANWQVSQPSASVFRSLCVKKLGLMTAEGFDTEYWNRICSRFDFYYLDESLCLMREHAHRSTVQDSDAIEFFSLMLFMTQSAAKYRFPAGKKKRVSRALAASRARFRQYIIDELIKHKRKYLDIKRLLAMVNLYRQCAPVYYFVPDLAVAQLKQGARMGVRQTQKRK